MSNILSPAFAAPRIASVLLRPSGAEDDPSVEPRLSLSGRMNALRAIVVCEELVSQTSAAVPLGGSRGIQSEREKEEQ